MNNKSDVSMFYAIPGVGLVIYAVPLIPWWVYVAVVAFMLFVGFTYAAHCRRMYRGEVELQHPELHTPDEQAPQHPSSPPVGR